MWGYKNSRFLQFAEEALAESAATGNVITGLKFGLGYVSIPKFAAEVGIGFVEAAFGPRILRWLREKTKQ